MVVECVADAVEVQLVYHSELIDGVAEIVSTKPTSAPGVGDSTCRVQISTSPARQILWVYHTTSSTWRAADQVPVFGTDGAPSGAGFVPEFTGQLFWDSINERLYYARGTSGSDWYLI